LIKFLKQKQQTRKN